MLADSLPAGAGPLSTSINHPQCRSDVNSTHFEMGVPQRRFEMGVPQRRTELLSAHNEKIAQAQSGAEKLVDLAVAIEVSASDEGRLFGSVTGCDVAEAANEKAGSDLAKSEVILPGGSIRQCGDYEVIADLGFEVTATFTVSIINRGAPEQILDEEGEAEAGTEAAADEGEAEAEAEAEAAASEEEPAKE